MRRTAIALVPALPDATPTIDEMGIPVATVEWGVPVHCDETVQRQIIQRAFGENIARSVPTMGARPGVANRLSHKSLQVLGPDPIAFTHPPPSLPN